MDPTPIEKLKMPLLTEKGVSLSIKREDLNHPHISGNKLRKLKYNLLAAKEQGHDTILTFGGAFSNHIYATAAAGAEEGLKTIGIIRGEEHLPLNPTLTFAKAHEMEISYLDRTRYKSKHSGIVLHDLKKKYGKFYLIPEGGTNELAIKGCMEILSPCEKWFSHYALSVGTGGTLAGIIQSLAGEGSIIGFSALKGSFLATEVNNLFKQFNLPQYDNWMINQDYHFNGYAKITDELKAFIHEMDEAHQLPLDPVYTAKTLFGLLAMIKEGMFPVGSEILMIHTGGLQGRKGFGL